MTARGKNKRHEDDTRKKRPVQTREENRQEEKDKQRDRKGAQRGRTSRVQGQGGMEEQGKKG